MTSRSNFMAILLTNGIWGKLPIYYILRECVCVCVGGVPVKKYISPYFALFYPYCFKKYISSYFAFSIHIIYCNILHFSILITFPKICWRTGPKSTCPSKIPLVRQKCFWSKYHLIPLVQNFILFYLECGPA